MSRISTSSVRAPGSPLRLTVRGRALVVALLVLLALAAFSVGRASVDAAVATSNPAFVTVQPGESLWTLARRVAPGVDPRETVDAVVQINSLPSADVRAGQRLQLPPP